MRITLISDTHTRHRNCELDLPGGDLLIHAGDFMNSGYVKREAEEFFQWLDGIKNYDAKVFIAGNHDRWMENEPDEAEGILTGFKTIDYLEDSQLTLYFDGPNGDMTEENVKIYGSPWQPEFYNWAFNLPKGGPGLMSKWEAIPADTDILITHGPPQDHLDVSGPPYNEPHLGCALLREKVDEQPPKIHVFGHIHGGYGYKFHNGTHFFNASILNERYDYVNKPMTFDWNPLTNEITFLNGEK